MLTRKTAVKQDRVEYLCFVDDVSHFAESGGRIFPHVICVICSVMAMHTKHSFRIKLYHEVFFPSSVKF